MRGNSGPRRCPAGAETLATQNRSSARRLEGYRVHLTTLIAGNFKALAFATCSSGSAKVCSTCVAARFATLGMGQVSFLVVVLLSLGKGKCCVALDAGNFNVWHDSVSPRAQSSLYPHLFRSGIENSGRKLRFQNSQPFISNSARCGCSEVINGEEFTPRQGLIQTKLENLNGLRRE